MKLSQKAAKRIAALINTTHCAIYMVEAMQKDGNAQGARNWQVAGAEATLRLHEEFGIVLPNLAIAQETVAMEVARAGALARLAAPRLV